MHDFLPNFKIKESMDQNFNKTIRKELLRSVNKAEEAKNQ